MDTKVLQPDPGSEFYPAKRCHVLEMSKKADRDLV
jgi:hypothetical protein